jgi:uncharacterized protein (DUF427 family)
MSTQQLSASRGLREPGPDHPIDICPAPHRVIVRAGGRIIANSRAALMLAEAGHDAVSYIPRADVDMPSLKRVTHTSFCPYKGDCSYYALSEADTDTPPLAWSYEAPGTKAAAPIAGYLAFYKSRVDAIQFA